MYNYSNEPVGTEIVSNSPEQVADRIGRQIDKDSKSLEAVIIGVDELWDVSLMKFIFDWTNRSVSGNSADFRLAGRLSVNNGVPTDARIRIDQMFEQVKKGNVDPSVLHQELENWQVFDEYQDRFFTILKGRRTKKSF